MRNIRDETYIDNGSDNNMQRIDDDVSREVENRDLNIGMLSYHPSFIQREIGYIGNSQLDFVRRK